MMTKTQRGLGRGLDALLSGSKSEKDDVLRDLSVAMLKPGKYQPRSNMEEASLQELAASIKAQGVIQPILARQLPDESYEIIAGERRWRAAQIAGLSHVPVLVRAVPDKAALAMALIENIQRENLNPLEEAIGIQRLIDEFEMTHQTAADAVGRSRSAASNLLRLLKLPLPVQAMLMENRLDMGHARALLALDGAQQIAAANKISQDNLSVREAEKLIYNLQHPAEPKKAREISRDVLSLQESLSERIGTNVTIKQKSKGAGQLVIDYVSHEQLDSLIANLQNCNKGA
ncbi:ParB/RepB/Spo0J family partition protein [Gallionella capsiferriformans]|jgi:ParB family chromosome partitioning protein|uniref:ParB-like partition protein n=1 Tax=Gallionella capsiferriformans (strain ES-2) TaxID=395494 RepID=D9SEN8_GALCS|nr:parB-like partition protein [Gallionella capsiferriformans ES-2]